MSQESESHVFSIPRGTSRARAIRTLLRQVDAAYTERPADTLPSSGQQVDEDSDVSSDPSIGQSTDVGEVQHEQGESDGDRGQSLASTVGHRDDSDEGLASGETVTSEPPSGTDEQQTPDERVPETSPPSGSEYGNTEFHFAPALHSRGTHFY